MTSETFFRGSGIARIVYLEVIPLISEEISSSLSSACPPLAPFAVKQHLQRQTQKISLSQDPDPDDVFVEWSKTKKTDLSSENKNGLALGYLFSGNQMQRIQFRTDSDVIEKGRPPSMPVFFLPSMDPSMLQPIPCILQAYASRQFLSAKQAMVTPATLVRILPAEIIAASVPDQERSLGMAKEIMFTRKLFGDSGQDFLSKEIEEEVRCNQNEESIRELTLRMTILCSKPIHIGTTNDAFDLMKHRLRRRKRMAAAVEACMGKKVNNHESVLSRHSMEPSVDVSSVLWNPFLLVHSPNHGDGKTLLVQTIAKKIGCSRIHIVRPGPIVAKYGIHADAALESILHGILTSAAVQPNKAPICIILDHLDSMMPPPLSGRSSAGDAAVPVFNTIAAYLDDITTSMERSKEFPFVTKNPMYNVGGSGGWVLSARFCLVAIVTCPDDGWRSMQRRANASFASMGGTTIFDAVPGGRYRLPTPTAETRWRAFKEVFRRNNLVLDEAANERLVILAASAAWAKGAAFQHVCQQVILSRGNRHSGAISTRELEQAFAVARSSSPSFADVKFACLENVENKAMEESFASVGGNVEAKKALEDALALDPYKRQMLAKFGFSPPTGILLYGPPGCGKTLLAKAVARLLKPSPKHNTTSRLPLGGTFISLGSSDLVRAEIGTSEKMLIAAFEFADKNAPAVVFLDEFQALFTERSRGGSGKLASTLLQCLDDVKRWSGPLVDDSSLESKSRSDVVGSRVVVLGATNTPWMVDKAFLRPGRFDRVVYVGLPTLNERESILRVHVDKMKFKDKEKDGTIEELCQSIARRSEGYSGADLAALCRAAAIRALMEQEDRKDKCWIKEAHFLKALDMDIKASSDDVLLGRLLKWKP